jgi:hypothetical protein
VPRPLPPSKLGQGNFREETPSNPTNPTHSGQEDYYPSFMGYGEHIILLNILSSLIVLDKKPEVPRISFSLTLHVQYQYTV